MRLRVNNSDRDVVRPVREKTGKARYIMLTKSYMKIASLNKEQRETRIQREEEEEEKTNNNDATPEANSINEEAQHKQVGAHGGTHDLPSHAFASLTHACYSYHLTLVLPPCNSAVTGSSIWQDLLCTSQQNSYIIHPHVAACISSPCSAPNCCCCCSFVSKEVK